MKHLYKLLFLCLLMPNMGLAQMNLVPNGSFEDTTHCPFGAEDIDGALGWYTAGASPDYFHPCANSATPQVGVPQNAPGYQLPYHGEAYAGIITYTTFNPNYRENMGILLQQPLIVGTQYFISAFISKGDAHSVWETDCATNKFGFRFSTFKFDAENFTPAPADNYAHVYSDSVITDSINWVQISGSFIADSAYTYLIIGNFFDSSSTTVVPCLGDSYYYVDDVCVSTSSTTCNVVSGLQTLHNNLVQLYPNPANNKIIIKNITGINHYNILNNTGYAVKDGIMSETENTIDISALPNGFYFLQLNNNQTFRFIISH